MLPFELRSLVFLGNHYLCQASVVEDCFRAGLFLAFGSLFNPQHAAVVDANLAHQSYEHYSQENILEIRDRNSGVLSFSSSASLGGESGISVPLRRWISSHIFLFSSRSR